MYDTEIWKPIKDYEGLYEVSDLGRVKNCRSYSPHTNSDKTKFGKLIKQRENNAGYLRVRLYKNNFGKDLFIHRLVAQTFIEQPEGKNIVNHIDCNKKNNHVSNLEWVSISENTQHAYKNQLIKTLTNKRKSNIKKLHESKKKKVSIWNNQGVELGVFNSLQDASLFFGFNKGYFSNVYKNGSEKFKVVVLGENQ